MYCILQGRKGNFVLIKTFSHFKKQQEQQLYWSVECI